MFINTRCSLWSLWQHVKAECRLLLGFLQFILASFLYDLLACLPISVRQRFAALWTTSSAIASDPTPISPRHFASRSFQVFEAVLLPEEKGQLVNVLFNKRDNRWELNPSMGETFSLPMGRAGEKEKVLLLCSKKLVRILGLGACGESAITVDDADNGRVDTYKTAVTQLPCGHDYRGKRGELLAELPLSSHDIFHVENLKHYLLHAYNNLEAAVQANAGAFMGTWLVTVPQLLNIIEDPSAHLACKTAFWNLYRLGFGSTVYLRPGDSVLGPMENARASGDIVNASTDATKWLGHNGNTSVLAPELVAAVSFLTTPPPGDSRDLPTSCPLVRILFGNHEAVSHWRDISSSGPSVGSVMELEDNDLPTRSAWVLAREACERDVRMPQSRTDAPWTELEDSAGQALPTILTSDISSSPTANLAATPPKSDLSDFESWIDDDRTPTRPILSDCRVTRNTSTEAVASFDMCDSGDNTHVSTVAHQGSTPGRPRSDALVDQTPQVSAPSFAQSSCISSMSSKSTASRKLGTEIDGHVSPVSSVSSVASISDCTPVILTGPGSSFVSHSGQRPALDVAEDVFKPDGEVANQGHPDVEMAGDARVTVISTRLEVTGRIDMHGNAFNIGSFVEGRYLAGEDAEFRSLSDSEQSRANNATTYALGEIDVPNAQVLNVHTTPGKKRYAGKGLAVDGEVEGVCQSPSYAGMYSNRRVSGRKGKSRSKRGGIWT